MKKTFPSDDEVTDKTEPKPRPHALAVLQEGGSRGRGDLVGGEGDDVVLRLNVPHPHHAIRRPRRQDEPVRVELRVAAPPHTLSAHRP